MRIDISTKKHPNVFAEIDDADAELIAPYRWAATLRRKKFYVRGRVFGRDILLHRFLMGEPNGMVIDHKDGNPLNNKRSNLRECTQAQNVIYAFENGAYDGHRVELLVHAVKRKGIIPLRYVSGTKGERVPNSE